MRVYRTHSGLRLLVTNQTFDPTSPETIQLLEEVGSDRLYIQLCKAQASFRARLTPKPWRCDTARPPVGYPRAGAADEQLHEAWLAAYDTSAAAYASAKMSA